VRGSSEPNGYWLRFMHEGFFALNTSCATVLLAFANSPSVSNPFGHLEMRMNHLLGIRQTDYIRGHFEFWIPALALAFCVLVLLRLFSKAAVTKKILRYFAGVAALFFLPVVVNYVDQNRGWLLAPPYGTISELVFAATVFFLFAYKKAPVPLSLSLAIVIAHYVFWYSFRGRLRIPNWDAPGCFGPLGPIIALGASVVWVAYVRSDASIVPISDEVS